MAEKYFDDSFVNTNPNRTKWLRGDPEVGGWYKYNLETGDYDLIFTNPISSVEGLEDALNGKSDIGHSHSSLGDINFEGAISVGGEAGISGSKIIGDKRITFVNGILTGFENV